MDFFFSDPKVSTDEYKRVRSNLYSKGWGSTELNEADKILRGDLFEETSSEQGVSTKELDGLIKWLNENTSKHGLSPKKVDELIDELKKKL